MEAIKNLVLKGHVTMEAAIRAMTLTMAEHDADIRNRERDCYDENTLRDILNTNIPLRKLQYFIAVFTGNHN
jgi:hypothetical protein